MLVDDYDVCLPCESSAGPTQWMIDSGSCHNLIGRKDVQHGQKIRRGNDAVRLQTANGVIENDAKTRAPIQRLGLVAPAQVLKDVPPVLSLGRLCVENKFDFIWRGSRGETPYLEDLDGNLYELVVDRFVPYLLEPHHDAANACPAQDAAPLAVSCAGEASSSSSSSS